MCRGCTFTSPYKTTQKTIDVTKEDKTAGPSSKFLHKVELGDSREHVNRLVDFGEAPEGGFPSWNLRYIKTVFLPSLSGKSFIKSHGNLTL